MPLNDSATDVDLALTDLGPLAWVLEELRKAVGSATRSLRRFVTEAESLAPSERSGADTSQLRIARQQLHQAAGAMDMVGQAPPAGILRAMEAAVQHCVQHPELCSEDTVVRVERASFGLLQYLEAVLQGKPASPVALFPQYRDVRALVGQDRAHPADLWPAEWRWSDPEMPQTAAPKVYDQAVRSRFEQAVLRVIKTLNADAARLLRDISLGFAAAQSARQPRVFWKVCAGFFEALSLGLCPNDVHVKRASSRILQQYTALVRGELGVSDRLAQDLVFFCAQARLPAGVSAPSLQAVRQAFGLDNWAPVDYEHSPFGHFDPALLAQARKRIGAAKEAWSSVAGGDLARVRGVADQFSLVADSLVKLHPPSTALAQGLTQAGELTARSGAAPSTALAMEVATSVMFLEAAFEELDPGDAQLAQRTTRLAQRLQRVQSGGAPEPLEPWIEELYRRVSDRQTMGSVVGELRSALGELERSLDQYFRNPKDASLLAAVPGQLSQMRGVMSVLGLDQAVRAVLRMRDTVEQLIDTDVDAAQARETGTFDKLGNNLGALGLLFDMLNYQPVLAKKLFVFNETEGELQPVMGRTGSHAPAAEAPPPAPPAPTPPAEEHALHQFLATDFQLGDVGSFGAPSEFPATNLGLPELPMLDDTAPVAGPPSAAHALSDNLLDLPASLTGADRPAPPLPPPAVDDDASDLGEDDLLGIFLEEAREVVQSGSGAIAALTDSPADLDQQTILRRAFHTLKGSSRMVGLSEFGDAAWSMEQVLNEWLADRRPASQELRALSQQALQGFAQWAQDIAAGDAGRWNARAFQSAAEALRLENRLQDIPLPLPDTAAPAAADDIGLDALKAVLAADAAQVASAQAAPTPDTPAEAAPAEPTWEDVFAADGPAADEAPAATEPVEALLDEALSPAAAPPSSEELPFDQELPFDDELAFDDPPSASADAPVQVEELSFDALDLDFPEFAAAAEASAAQAAAEATEPAPAISDIDFDSLVAVTAPAQAAEGGEERLTSEPLPEAAPEPALGGVPDTAPDMAPELAFDVSTEPVPEDLLDGLLDAAPETPAVAALPDEPTEALHEPALSDAIATEPVAVEPASEEPAPAEAEVEAAAAEPEWVFDIPDAAEAAAPEASPEPLPEALVAPAEAALALPVVDDVDAQIQAEFDAELAAEWPDDGAALPLLPDDASSLDFDSHDEQTRVIGSLRIGIPLYNVYLNEADEWSRRLLTELAEWELELQLRPLGDSTVALAHSLAGSSATVGFTALSGLARELEHALEWTQLQGIGTVEEGRVFTAAAEDIRRLLHQFAAGFLKEPNPDVVEALRQIHAEQPLPEEPLPFSLADALAAAPAPIADTFDTDDALDLSDLMAPEPLPVTAEERPAHEPPVRLEAPAQLLLPQAQTVLLSESEFAQDDDDIEAVDALDPDLLQIFEEEAAELLPLLGGALRQWVARPDNVSARAEVLRVLHTLKGSARLAGAMRMGERAHRMETAIERLDAHGASSEAAQIEPLLASFDTLQTGFENLHQAALAQTDAPVALLGDALPDDVPSDGEVPVADASADQAAAPADAATPVDGLPPAAVPVVPDAVIRAPLARPATALAALPARSGAGQAVRIRSQLLDRLVNQTGEVMMTRSRLEAGVGQLRSSLGDLGGNLDRLRQQLRDVELQAELQMQSRLAQTKDVERGFDPLEFDRFTRVQELTRMMAESVNDVATVQRNLQRTLDGAEADLVAQARQARELQRDLLRTRMIEFETIAERLYRVVRQAAKESGKQVKLDITGGSIEMDRGVLDRMTPSFEHLLRNAVVHGVEDAATREAAGKPGAGTILIHLHHEGNDVSITFSDDGAGLNRGGIRDKALSLGLITADQALEPSDLLNLIFMPGFSTAAQITELAGRGIGMDVVRSEVLALGGRIESASEVGTGTRFNLVLPLTTAVTQVVMVRAGSLSFGVPSNVVEQVRRTPLAELKAAYTSGVYRFGAEDVPFFWSGALLQASAHSDEAVTRTASVVVFRSAQQRLALHVDEVLGNQEVVVKNLGPQLSRLPGLSGMTVLASGAVVLIYNPVALASVYGVQARRLQSAQLAPEGAGSPASAGGARSAAASAASQVPLVLVVDDSITVRRVTQRLLQREGYRVALAVDGVQAMERLREELPAVMLSDIEMPRMDGFELARSVRISPVWKDLPIITISSRMAEKHREMAREIGVNHYLGKPYGEEELLSLIRRYARPLVPA